MSGERRADTLGWCGQSSYLDVIESHPEWLGAPFVEEAEYLRSVDERAWRSEYLGEVTGTGGSVFNNVVSAWLPDARCRGFSRMRCGVGWGLVPRPVAVRALRLGARRAEAHSLPGALCQPKDPGGDGIDGDRRAHLRGRGGRGAVPPTTS